MERYGDHEALIRGINEGKYGDSVSSLREKAMRRAETCDRLAETSPEAADALAREFYEEHKLR